MLLLGPAEVGGRDVDLGCCYAACVPTTLADLISSPRPPNPLPQPPNFQERGSRGPRPRQFPGRHHHLAPVQRHRPGRHHHRAPGQRHCHRKGYQLPLWACATAAATVASAAAGGDLCGGVLIRSDAEFEALAPYTRKCAVMSSLSISGWGGNATQLAAAFVNLRFVSGAIYLQNNPNITTVDGCFLVLETVGTTFTISRTANLGTLDGGFTALKSVGDSNLEINNNPNLATLDGSFAALTSVGGILQIQANVMLTTLDGGFPALTSRLSNSETVRTAGRCTPRPRPRRGHCCCKRTLYCPSRSRSP